jgi:hypothetical protein
MTTDEHPNQYIFDHSIKGEREAYLTGQLVTFNRANTGFVLDRATSDDLFNRPVLDKPVVWASKHLHPY